MGLPIWLLDYARRARAATRRFRSENDPNGEQSIEDIHSYWRKPWDNANTPMRYATIEGGQKERSRAERTSFLVDLIKIHTGKNDPKILELGCNVGRNLQGLYEAGYRELHGIEISAEAVALLRTTYPELANCAHLFESPIEQAIVSFEDDSFDVVFTMAVLEHIHSESEWIFAQMVRVANDKVITIEDERTGTWRHFPRDYSRIFKDGLGMREVASTYVVPGLPSAFVARIFEKESNVDRHDSRQGKREDRRGE